MAKAIDLGVDDVLEVLTGIYGLEGEVHQKELRILCPSHADSNPSCGVNIDTGYWNCWSCEAGGDIIDLGHVVLKKPRKEIKALLKIKDPSLQLAGVRRRLKARREEIKPKAKVWTPTVPQAGSYAPGPLSVLKARGFTRETLRKWGVRYVESTKLESTEDDHHTFEISDCFAIPVNDERSETKMWVYGRTEASPGWIPKYLNTPGVDKQSLWWGLEHHHAEDEIAVTEGILDAMWCDQWGIPAVANLGTNLKNETANLRKIERLTDFRKVTLFMDNDNAGLVATRQLGDLLHRRGVACSVVRYKSWMLGPKGKPAGDPQDLDRLDLQLCYWRAIPYVRWRLGS